MKPRSFPLALALATVALVAGCAASTTSDARIRVASTVAASTTAVDFDGVRGVSFGDSRADLANQGALATAKEACGPRLTGLAEVSPVFADDRLVLMWVNRPFATPEGVGVGSTVDAVKAAYPAATALTAPEGTYRYDGLMVTSGDRAYLFLHDGQTVQKSVAGFAEYTRLLFDEGFGAC